MNGRAISFVLFSSLLMVGALTLSHRLPPQRQSENSDETTLVATRTAGLPSELATTPPQEGEKADPGSAPSGNTATDAGDNTATDSEVGSDTDGTTDTETPSASGNQKGSDSQPEDSPAKEAAPKRPADKLYTIGSLASDSNQRYLITLNLAGGTIRRVELNYREKENGRFKYRDLEHKSGYIGSLECLDTPQGVLIRTVGHGTPAYDATSPDAEGGLRPGDILVSFDDEPVASAEDFDNLLEKKTKPGQTIELMVQRNGGELKFEVVTTNKPIELLRPEKTRIDPDFRHPESFVFSLLKPLKQLDLAWPDLDREMRTAYWTLEPADAQAPGRFSMSYEIPDEKLKPLGFRGPIRVIKHFQIPQLQPEERYTLDSRTFHFNLEIEIINRSDQPQTIAYELDGPSGAPTETWWYANKIHGRSTALGRMAGARDIVGSTEAQPYIFYSCPEIVSGAMKHPPHIYFLCDPFDSDPKDHTLHFAGVDALYFNITLLPSSEEGQPFEVNSTSVFPTGGKLPKKVRLRKLVNVTFQAVKTVTLDANQEPGTGYRQVFEVFSGPKEPKVLSHYGLSNTRTFGWFAWVSIVLLAILHFFYLITFKFSYGLAIVMLTVLVRCLILPFSRKAARNAQMMQHLQPQMKELTEKYKDDMEKRAAAQRELFKRYNYNPFGGCFMMFFQLPIFMGLYRGLATDIALRDQPLIPGMSWCSNLSGPDQLLYWKDWMPLWLADETGWLGPYLNILPLLTMCLFLAQQKLFMPPAADDQAKMMQKMMTFMMLFMGIMFFKVPAGLCIYFITSSLWGIVERKLLPKPVLLTDDLTASEGTGTGSQKTQLTRAQQKAQSLQEAKIEERKLRNTERKKRLKKRNR